MEITIFKRFQKKAQMDTTGDGQIKWDSKSTKHAHFHNVRRVKYVKKGEVQI